jgi:hypothetical protein
VKAGAGSQTRQMRELQTEGGRGESSSPSFYSSNAVKHDQHGTGNQVSDRGADQDGGRGDECESGPCAVVRVQRVWSEHSCESGWMQPGRAGGEPDQGGDGQPVALGLAKPGCRA